ncbi:hypothetical protein [Streptomyces pinistramenti]|nr:hypothetical protein [Streptomyces pinistramenti]
MLLIRHRRPDGAGVLEAAPLLVPEGGATGDGITVSDAWTTSPA